MGDDGGAFCSRCTLRKRPCQSRHVVCCWSVSVSVGVGVMMVSGNRRSMGMCLDFELGRSAFSFAVIA